VIHTYILIAQLIFTIGTTWGIYKTKVDLDDKKANHMTNFYDLSERITRLEEKVNFIINTLMNKRDEKKNF